MAIEKQTAKYALIISALAALLILINELLSLDKRNRLPGGSYPIEFYQSLPRVLIFCSVILIAFLLFRQFQSKIKSVHIIVYAVIGLLLTLSSPFWFSHFSLLGWCCEPNYGFQYGFPFSFVIASLDLDWDLAQTYKTYSLLELLGAPSAKASWLTDPIRLALNFVFWASGFALMHQFILFGNRMRTQH